MLTQAFFSPWGDATGGVSGRVIFNRLNTFLETRTVQMSPTSRSKGEALGRMNSEMDADGLAD